MIKNIVFDMGKVLLNYDARRGCRPFTKTPEDEELMVNCLFSSMEWLMLDMGIISDETALERVNKRLPERLHETARLCLAHWHEHCMWPIAGMDELVKHLKEQGYGIYLCSNAAIRMTANTSLIPGIKYFDGVLFSAEVLCMKPQKEMYEHLFSRFDLKPEECFFIDDVQMNIDSARTCGMDGHCFEDQNIERLRRVLDALKEN